MALPYSGRFGGFLLLTAYFAIHLAGDPGVPRPSETSYH
jgi:hypothetical protein